MFGSNKDIIIPFSKVDKFGIEVVGLKAANLGKLVSRRLPVPNGFVIATVAFNQHFTVNKLDEFIDKELVNVDPQDSVRLENASKRIRRGILKIRIDKDLKNTIARAYASLSGFTDAYVAIRSSSLLSDLKKDTFAGQYSTFLNIKGKEDVIEKVKYCWASMFSPQNLFYVLSGGLKASSLKMSVIVQKMIQAEVSGIMFTVNPIDNDKTKIAIECILGLGEALVHGQLIPDSYMIEKSSSEIIEKRIVPQEWMLVRKGRVKKGEDPNVKVKVSEVWKVRQKLESKYIKKLVKVGKSIEKDFGEPQDIEWAYEGGRIWIVQTRPITTLKIDANDSWKKTPTFAALKAKVEVGRSTKPKQKLEDMQVIQTSSVINKKGKDKIKQGQKLNDGTGVLLTGKGSNAGLGVGSVRIVKSSKELRNVKKGNVIVASRITPDYEGKLKGVAAIITDVRNRDSYETIMAKGLGIPCIVDTNIATKVLRNEELITVNGETGEIFTGASDEALLEAEKIVQEKMKQEEYDKNRAKESEVDGRGINGKQPKSVIEAVKTATKVFVSIDDPNQAPSIAGKYVDGAGNVNIEKTIEQGGVHPQMALKRKKDKEKFINDLVLGLFRVARSFDPRPVIYKLSDITSEKYSTLSGGNEFEMREPNPIMGLRGASRLIANTDELEFELEAIRVIRNKENIKNVWIAIPYVRTYDELREMKQLISSFGFRRSSTFKLFLVVQVPSTVIQIEKLLEIGMDGVIIDIDLLSQLILGVDRNNPKIAPNYKGTHSSVLWALEKVIKACNKAKVYSQVCGQAVSANPKLIKKIIEFGVTSVLVEPDMLEQTREYVHDAEVGLIVKRKK